MVVLGLPRSGNTWLCRILADIYQAPLIDPLATLDTWGVGMCHHPPNSEILGRKDFIHAVGIVRDMRAVVASWFTYYKRNPMPGTAKPHVVDIQTFYRAFLRSRLSSLYEAETSMWRYQKYGIPVIQYEFLLENPHLQVRFVLDIFGTDASDLQIRDALANSAFLSGSQQVEFAGISLSEDHFGSGLGLHGWQKYIDRGLSTQINTDFPEHQRLWGIEV